MAEYCLEGLCENLKERPKGGVQGIRLATCTEARHLFPTWEAAEGTGPRAPASTCISGKKSFLCSTLFEENENGVGSSQGWSLCDRRAVLGNARRMHIGRDRACRKKGRKGKKKEKNRLGWAVLGGCL
eukprot:1146015-Pelagomonas_calceolata.AAC.5